MRALRYFHLLLGCFVTISLLSTPLPGCTETSLSAGPIVPRALRYIRQSYVDPGRIEPKAMLRSALEEIQTAVPEIMVGTQQGASMTVTVGQASKTFRFTKLRTVSDLWNNLRTIFAFIEKHYDGDTDTRDIEYLAVEGIFRALDPHSALFRPKDYKEFQVGTKGDFGGVGIMIGIRDAQLVVISPLDGSPAARAGLKAKDRIVQINEHSTINMPLNEAVDLIRGKIGSKVALRIERDGSASFTVTLTRAQIEIDSVQSELVTHDGNYYAYLKVKTFQDNTFSDAQKQVEAMHTAANTQRGDPTQNYGVDGLILDLRNNPGGLLYQSVLLADYFLRDGTIVATVGSERQFIERHDARSFGTQRNYPMVALINEGSASASEIVSGALQANQRALVIGARTYGKGSVQSVYDLRDGSGMKLTVAEYLAAGKHRVQEVGVTPDIHLLPVTADPEQMNLIENIAFKESDLDKHFSKGKANDIKEAQYELRFAQKAQPQPDKDDKDAAFAYDDSLKLGDDFPVQFAQQLLSTGLLMPLGKDWPDLHSVIAAEQAVQDEKIIADLTALGINWSSSEKSGKPKLAIESYLRQDGKRISRVQADSDAELVLRVTNNGRRAIHRLMGQTTADEPLFANKEFVFGKLAPGQSKTWAAPFSVPSQMLSEQLPVTVKFQAQGKSQPDDYVAMIPIRALPNPRFRYRYSLNTKALSIGRSVTLQVDIENTGAGTSEEAIASISRVDGLIPFIETGRVTLGKIKPGKTTTAKFRFHVDPDDASDQFELQLSIIDSKTFAAVTDKLTFTLGSGDILPPAKQWYSAPEIAMDTKSLPEQTTQSSLDIQGVVTDNTQVKDVFVFVGTKKVYYATNPQLSAQSTLQTNVQLEEGTNIITVAARDNDSLLARRIFKVYRAK